MDNETPNPLNAIDASEVMQGIDWNWLMLTPFPATVVLFGIVAGLIILGVAWFQPESRRSYSLLGGGIVLTSLLFWVFIVAAVGWMLRYRRTPGLQSAWSFPKTANRKPFLATPNTCETAMHSLQSLPSNTKRVSNGQCFSHQQGPSYNPEGH